MTTVPAKDIDTTVTERIAEWVTGLTWDTLPDNARHASRRTFANAVGLAVGAADHPVPSTILDTALAAGARGRARILARHEVLAPQWVSMVMGAAMHVEDFDDTHLRTILHPGPPTAAAALGAAQIGEASGRDILVAVAAGVEISSRLGNAVGVGHFDRGWHMTGTMGHIGAAVTAGRLLGLGSGQLTNAIALAATQAQGHTEQNGAMTKALHPGKAGFDGVEAALLASHGYAGPREPLFGRRGLAALMTPGRPDIAELTDDLGARWELNDNAFKPYACGIVSHPVIDAAVELRAKGVMAAEVETVDVFVHPVVLEVMGIEDPVDGLQSKFSVHHCFAIGLLDGGAGPVQYSDDRARSEDVRTLRAKVRVTNSDSIPRGSCTVKATLRDGKVITLEVAHATGSVQRPMTDEQLRAKFLLVTTPVIGANAESLWDIVFRLEETAAIDVLFDAAARRP